MPTYPVKHKETGETKELSMSMTAYGEWREENPDWDKDWSAGVAGVGEVGEVYDKLKKHILDGTMFCIKHRKLLDLQ